MRSATLKLILALAIAAVSLNASVALGNSVMTYNGTGLNAVVKIHASGLLSDGRQVRAGQYLISYEGNDYTAYCVDIDAWAGTTEVVELGVDSLNNGDQVAYLYETYAGGVSTGTGAGALAVSIWEVLYETSSTFGVSQYDGFFSISENPGVTSAGNSLLATVPGSYTPLGDLVVLYSECRQDMLIMIPGGGQIIPEPITVLGLLLGTGSLAGYIRRRVA